MENSYASLCWWCVQRTAERKVEQAAEVQETASSELDMLATRHKGQFALRKLYHESPRLLAVFYTSPSCGPCRTLKPIFNKVIDEYGDKVYPPALIFRLF